MDTNCTYLFYFSVQTPDGLVQLKHWENLVAIDDAENTKFGIKRCPGLTNNHIQMTGTYKKMNVAMAYQVCFLIITGFTHFKSFLLITLSK